MKKTRIQTSKCEDKYIECISIIFWYTNRDEHCTTKQDNIVVP